MFYDFVLPTICHDLTHIDTLKGPLSQYLSKPDGRLRVHTDVLVPLQICIVHTNIHLILMLTMLVIFRKLTLLCSTYCLYELLYKVSAVDWHTVAVALETECCVSIIHHITKQQTPLSFTLVDPCWNSDTSKS